MQRLFLILTLISAVLLSGCKSTSYKKTDNGIIVNNIRLQPINDRVIKVSAIPEGEFSSEESLITDPELTFSGDFMVSEDSVFVTLSTKEIDAKVNKTTGEVSFFDKSGSIILKENIGGGKSFTPIEVDGTHGYTLHQVFESPDDEAFYGLGQHQSDEFNYKGKNESLYQYNTKVSVPFVVSNKNYGILWDNYSWTKFGDPRDYDELNQFKLYDKDGNEGGLTATYTNEISSERVVRKESVVSYEDLERIKEFPQGFPLNGAKVTWEGEIESDKDGVHRFHIRYAGYTKIFVNNEEVVEERCWVWEDRSCDSRCF